MARSRDLAVRLALLAACAAAPSCAAPVQSIPATQVPPQAGAVAPAPVNDAELAASVHRLLLDGSQAPARLALLVGVVRRQFAHALERFEAGDDKRGLAALTGALMLVRAGELRPEMFDATAAKAFEHALGLVAPAGDEARALAFLRLRAASLPKDSPAQTEVAQHLRALEAWMKDTRRLSAVENAAADQRTLGERAALEPTAESLEAARAATDKWVATAIDFNAEFRPGVDHPKRDELVEAYRGMRAGALVLAALYLRHGDAAGAVKALERSEARRICPPELLERLETASGGTEPHAWADLGTMYASAHAPARDERPLIAPEIARGAAWGAMLEAYRRQPANLVVASKLARLLANLGLPEAAPAVLAEPAREARTPAALGESLALVLRILLAEDHAHDAPSCRRVFAASKPLLEMSDATADPSKLEPSPAQIRFVMASVETRAGEPVAARALLELAVRQQPSIQSFGLLATVLRQAGDGRAALEAVTRALAAPDAPLEPLARCDAHLTAFQIHRASGAIEPAKADLARALEAALEARSKATTAGARVQTERLLARIAYHYGDRAACARAIERGFEAAGSDRNAVGTVLIEAAAMALLQGEVPAARKALRRAVGLEVGDEDVVYAALWVQLAERVAKSPPDETAARSLSSVRPGPSWISSLAEWGLGKIQDPVLVSRARDASQRAEAAFYVAMRKRAAADASADAELARIGRGPAIQLVETHIAHELTLAPALRSLGPSPTPLP
jgi:tetratricopeptide (TPR) repeat protein